MSDKPRIDFSRRATAPIPPIAKKPLSEEYAEGAQMIPPPEAEQPDRVPELIAKVERLERIVDTFVEWFEAAGAAETLHVRDGFGTKTHLAACARRDALRVKVSELIRG